MPMHPKTKAFLDKMPTLKRCRAGGLGEELSALLNAATDATTEAITSMQAFYDAEEAETDTTMFTELYQYQSVLGGLERELRKLRDQIQVVRDGQRQFSALDERVGASKRGQP